MLSNNMKKLGSAYRVIAMCHTYYSSSGKGEAIGYTLFNSRIHLDAVAERDALVNLRFWLVAVVGGSVAVFGMVANGLLARLFVSRLNFRHSPFFFLGFVALFDTLLDLIYLLLLTPPILGEHFNWVHLYLYWLPQARWLYLFGQIFKISSCFCLIVASFERYMMTRHWTFSGFDYRTRWFILGCAIFGAIFVKLFTAVDVVVVFNRNCSRIFQRYTIGQAGHKEWLASFINLLTVIIPFGTLVFLNGGIVLMLRHQNVQVAFELNRFWLYMHLGVYDTIFFNTRMPDLMEYLYPGLLQRTYPYQYRICSDCASLMTVLGNALRFPAHICSNKEISEQLQLMLCASDKEIEVRSFYSTSVYRVNHFLERLFGP
uniref:G protein-coupled receptor n=1 Tax=Ditylenchus dipsaci TaxID=166011 RepID=A0A915DIX0_9BILA